MVRKAQGLRAECRRRAACGQIYFSQRPSAAARRIQACSALPLLLPLPLSLIGIRRQTTASAAPIHTCGGSMRALSVLGTSLVKCGQHSSNFRTKGRTLRREYGLPEGFPSFEAERKLFLRHSNAQL